MSARGHSGSGTRRGRETVRRRHDDGTSLAEIMVALLIFALMSVGTVYATGSMLHITRDARNRQVAANLAAQEIDKVRAAKDVLSVVDNSFSSEHNGTTFYLSRTSSWVPTSGGVADGACGASTGGENLRYKEVTVTVTWDKMRSATAPVTSNTLLNPHDPVVDESKSTILVTVVGADGTGRQGVTVTATGPSTVRATTDNQGCAYLLKVAPGSYTVTASKTAYLDQDQQASPASTTSVHAGATASVRFQYDLGATLALRFAPDYDAAAPVRTVASLPVTLANSYASTVMTPPSASTAMTQSFTMHPFPAGYSVHAGACTAADPTAWGADPPAPVGTVGGSTVEVPVPMGVVLVTPPPGGTRELVAFPVRSAVPGDPGCDNLPSNVSYSFGTAPTYLLPGGTTTAVALPYGSWQLRWGGAVVPATQMTSVGVPAQTTVNPANNIVTFDPRRP
ncbi:MAG: carboxypeptidase-like regulatory domain-containing protein [Micrococcales bacterium]|nr:carboxypeptidase-like regulatory domain-containing protein [Micrococcales bacterium]